MTESDMYKVTVRQRVIDDNVYEWWSEAGRYYILTPGDIVPHKFRSMAAMEAFFTGRLAEGLDSARRQTTLARWADEDDNSPARQYPDGL